MHISANGVFLFYKKSGSGPPLILLHGNGEDHRIFEELGAKLAAHFTLYALDSRNHGQSEKTEDYSYETMAGDLYAFIQALALSQVCLLGFSDGAIVSLLLAMEHPEVVRKMALLGVNLQPDDFTPESYQFVRDAFAQTGDPLFRLMLEQPDIELAEVQNVETPALVIAGENDIFRPETFSALAKAMPKAELKIMAGHDHDSYIAHQDLLYPDLLSFFG